MISSIVAIFAGLVLLSGSLRSVPAIGPGLERFARWLSLFDVAIGVVAIVVGAIAAPAAIKAKKEAESSAADGYGM